MGVGGGGGIEGVDLQSQKREKEGRPGEYEH